MTRFAFQNELTGQNRGDEVRRSEPEAKEPGRWLLQQCQQEVRRVCTWTTAGGNGSSAHGKSQDLEIQTASSDSVSTGPRGAT